MLRFSKSVGTASIHLGMEPQNQDQPQCFNVATRCGNVWNMEKVDPSRKSYSCCIDLQGSAYYHTAWCGRPPPAAIRYFDYVSFFLHETWVVALGSRGQMVVDGQKDVRPWQEVRECLLVAPHLDLKLRSIWSWKRWDGGSVHERSMSSCYVPYRFRCIYVVRPLTDDHGSDATALRDPSRTGRVWQSCCCLDHLRSFHIISTIFCHFYVLNHLHSKKIEETETAEIPKRQASRGSHSQGLPKWKSESYSMLFFNYTLRYALSIL